MACLGRLEHKTQSRIVALVFDTGKASCLALEAHAASLAQTHPVECPIGPSRYRLSQHCIQVLGQPTGAQSFRSSVQRILGEAVLLPKSREGGLAFLLAGTGNATSGLPGWIGSHLALGEHRIVELSPGFQVRTQTGS